MQSRLILGLALALGALAACSSTSGGRDGGGGQGGEPESDSGTSCSPTCGAGSVCVASGVSGGAILMVNDAGVCPSGDHPTGNGFCTQDLAYACQSIPAACGGTVTCTCASSLCGGRTCDGYSGGLLSCVDLVP